MGFLTIPKFTMTNAVREHLELSKTHLQSRPLDICKACNHIKCSCGHCHNSLQCAEPCLYEASSGGTSRESASSGDGKVWCAACGGNYLPHDPH